MLSASGPMARRDQRVEEDPMRMLTKRWGGDISPWHEFETLSERMRRWADFPPFGTTLFRAPLLTETTEWLPAVELVENEEEFVLTAEIPGMAKEDVVLSVSCMVRPQYRRRRCCAWARRR
jgi:HSP20 family molecular chaperone IbpA